MKLRTKYIIGISIASVLLIVILYGVLSIGFLGSGSDKLMNSMTSMHISESAAGYNKAAYDQYAQQNVPPSSTESETPFDSMYFENYGVNTFKDVSSDPLSTFALDVDTASYTIAKSYIMRGVLPPMDAIRPEEFVNYFDYDYKSYENKFAIYPGMIYSPFGDDKYLLRLGVKAPEPVNNKNLVVTFVVDVSGSMKIDNRSGLVKKTLKYLISNLDKDDVVSIVKYNTKSTVLIEHTSAVNTDELFAAIERLEPRGSTNVQAGLLSGYNLSQINFDPNAQNRVMLFSDGVANTGTISPDDLIKQLIPYKLEGITFTAVGFGLGNYNDVLMEQIANNVDGNYAYINDFSEVQRVFGDNLASTLFTVAKDAKIQVEFNPDYVKTYRLVGYENRALSDDDFKNDSVDAGELGSGHEATAIYELEMLNTNANSENILANVSLRYEDTLTGEIEEINQLVTGNYLTGAFSNTDNDMKLAVISARFAQILKHSQPPPQIETVDVLLSATKLVGEEEIEFKDVVSNAKRLIELAQTR